MIFSWIEKNLDKCNNPYFQGKTLKGKLNRYWRYRVGNYRIISVIKNDELIILIIEIGHQREIYK